MSANFEVHEVVNSNVFVVVNRVPGQYQQECPSLCVSDVMMHTSVMTLTYRNTFT